MALLVGQETESAGVALAPAAELACAVQFTAAKTGKVTALHVQFSANGTATSVQIALQADEAGKPKAGVLVEATISSSTAGAHEIAVTETEVVSGTVYWLTILAIGGVFKIKPGTTTNRRATTVKHPKISEAIAGDWSANKVEGPMSIWATGTEAGSTGLLVTKSAESKVLIGGTERIVGTAGLVTTSATDKIVVGGTEKIVGTAGIATKSKVIIGGTERIVAQAGLTTQAKVVIGGSQALAALAALAAKSAQSKLVIAGTQAIKGIGAAVKRAIVFIFED